MAVYTSVTIAGLEGWLSRYGVGAVKSFTPIASGIENTNYFLDTEEGAYVLTIYERIPTDELPFYLNLVAHLARNGVLVPVPIADRSGALFSLLQGKPAGLVTRLRGASNDKPSVRACARVGEELAKMHLASSSYRPRLTNRRGPGWMLATSRSVRPFLNAEQNELLANEITEQRKSREARADKLPSGAIHADLFRDNVLFDGETLTGMIDFGFAATDLYVFDLAVTVNDWCIDQETTEFDDMRLSAMIQGYLSIRALDAGECAAWPMMLRLGTLRFWLSRLYDLHFPRAAEVLTPKDPLHFERMLRARIARPGEIPAAQIT
jgi:homoserine kinase type II